MESITLEYKIMIYAENMFSGKGLRVGCLIISEESTYL